MAYGTPVLGSSKSRGGNNNQKRRKKPMKKWKRRQLDVKWNHQYLFLRMHGFV